MLFVLLCFVLTAVNSSDYDYIVVGSASGGVVASRLAESGSSVLLIEAGPNDLTYSCSNCNSPPNGDLMAGSILIPFRTSWYVPLDDLHWKDDVAMESYWNYDGTILERQQWLLRGKMLGGCLSHNGHEWSRGSSRDYDFVAQKLNLPDWSFKNVLPFYQKIETYLGENKTLRGNNGPIEIIQLKPNRFEYKLQALFDSAINYGLPYNNHLNGDHSQYGVSFGESNIGKYKNDEVGLFNTSFYRESSSKCYIRDIGISSGRLTVWYDTTVQRVLFNEEKQVIGVEYWNDNILEKVYCNKEVIVSAGVYQSPQLLMLSGIGPIEELNKFNIAPILINENIGKYGQDHSYFYVYYRVNLANLDINYDETTPNNVSSIYSPLTNERIYFYNPGRIEFFLSSNKYDRLGFDYNDIRIPCYANGIFQNNPNYDIIQCTIDSSINSKNLTIELRSSDSREYPKVYNNYFIDPTDYDLVIEGIYKLRQIFESNSNVFSQELFPGKWKNVDLLRYDIWKNSGPSLHAVGTLSMGPNHQFAVDSKCSLRGVDGLRIVDTSIWPYSINGGTQSLAFMIGEKCAKHIIDDNNQNHNEIKKHDDNNHNNNNDHNDNNDDNKNEQIIIAVSCIFIIICMFIACIVYKCIHTKRNINDAHNDLIQLISY